MNPEPFKHREIVETERFVKELAALEKDSRKADEFVDGAKWVLCRGPRTGVRIDKGPVWLLPMAVADSADCAVLYYTFTEDHVYFLSIQKTEYPPKEPGE